MKRGEVIGLGAAWGEFARRGSCDVLLGIWRRKAENIRKLSVLHICAIDFPLSSFNQSRPGAQGWVSKNRLRLTVVIGSHTNLVDVKAVDLWISASGLDEVVCYQV